MVKCHAEQGCWTHPCNHVKPTWQLPYACYWILWIPSIILNDLRNTAFLLMFINANPCMKFRHHKRVKKKPCPSAGKDNFVRSTGLSNPSKQRAMTWRLYMSHSTTEFIHSLALDMFYYIARDSVNQQDDDLQTICLKIGAIEVAWRNCRNF